MKRWYKIFVIISLCGPIIGAVSQYMCMCTCIISYDAGCWGARNEKLKLICAGTQNVL